MARSAGERMNPWSLTHQIILQIKSITQDSELNPIETWQDWRTVWCEPIPKTGREFFKLQTMNAEITEAFKIRYIAGINPHQRVKFRGKYFEIIEVINTGERNEEIVLTCKGAI